MRLRRIGAVGAVTAAVAATVFATTAAVFPSAPTDPMQPLPAFTSQALAARYAANSRRDREGRKICTTIWRPGSRPGAGRHAGQALSQLRPARPG